MSALRLITDQQRQGVEFLARSSVAMLADVPGLGKTAQLVRACDRINASTVTAIVPSQELAENLRGEFEKWSGVGLPVHVMEDGKDDMPAAGVLITTFGLASQPRVKKELSRRACDVLICDEGHGLKDGDSLQTRSIMQKSGAMRNAKRFWIATGTPAPNHAGELYVFAKIAGVWTGSHKEWCERFCILQENAHGIQVIGSKNHEELKSLLAPHYLRREVVDGLPPLTVDTVEVDSAGIDPYIELPDELRAAVEAALEAGNWTLEGVGAVATVRRLTGIAKASGVVQMAAAELEAGQKNMLIFCQHTAVIEQITRGLAAYGAERFDGSVSTSKRIKIIRAFQSGDGPRVIVGHTRSLGEGHTLHATDRVIIAEPSWTPKDNDQCIARSWRRGQLKSVRATFICLRNSLDQRITAIVRRKTSDIRKIV